MLSVNWEAESKHISCYLFEKKKNILILQHVKLFSPDKGLCLCLPFFLDSPMYTMGSQLKLFSFCYQSDIPHFSNKKSMAQSVAVNFAAQMSVCF